MSDPESTRAGPESDSDPLAADDTYDPHWLSILLVDFGVLLQAVGAAGVIVGVLLKLHAVRTVYWSLVGAATDWAVAHPIDGLLLASGVVAVLGCGIVWIDNRWFA